MAKAFKCDRCGGFYEPGSKSKCEYSVTKMNWNSQSNPKAQDLCPQCYGSFERWWSEPMYELKKDREG